MTQIVRPLYKCTQVAFYATGRLLLQNLDDNLADFTLLSLSYDASFLTNLRQEVSDAEAMPDAQQRGEESQVMRIQLQPLAKKCLNNWQKLKVSYIQKAFPETEWEARWGSAGLNYYDKAAHENWENLKQLNESGATFINAKNTELLLNDNMPVGFKADFFADALAYKTLYESFLPAQETTPATNAKINANNLLYKKFSQIDNDGQVVYPDDGAMQDLFTWGKVLAIVAPAGSAGLLLKVFDLATNLPIEGAAIKIRRDSDAAIAGVTDVNGEFQFDSLNPGSYICEASRNGYILVQFTKDVNTGVNARKDVGMSAV